MENEKIKKIFLVIGFLVFISLIGFLIWRIFFKQSTILSPTTTNSDTAIFDGLPTSADGTPIIADTNEQNIVESEDAPQALKPQEAQVSGDSNYASPIAIGGLTQTTTIVDSLTLKPTLSIDGNSIQFYNKDDGQFYKINENGELVLLSDKIFKNASNVEWAPNKTKAVIEFSNQTKIVYDFNTDKQITLPSHWEDFTFSPDSKKLINKSLGTDSNNNWLVVSNSDGSQTKSLEKIEASNNSIIPYWSPNNQSVAMYTKSLDINKKEVIFIGEYGQSFKSIIVEGQDFQPQWSQNGEKLLYSVSSPKNGLKPNLWIVNANGDQTGTSRKNLGLETWAEKCVFVSNSEVYCAVPKYIENSSGIFSETAMVTSDDLYKINIETGQKTLIAIPDQNYNISSIMIDKNQSNLFFTDGSSEEIHKINLQN